MLKKLTYLLPAILLFSCNGCGDEKPTSIVASNDGSDTAVETQLPSAPQEIYEAVDKDLQVYFDAMNSGDYVTHVERAHPGIFHTEDEKIYQIETLADWRKKGLVNYARNIEIEYISPGVQLDTSIAYAVYLTGDFIVDFEDHFEGNRATYDGQIKATFVRFPMEWDSVKTQYSGHGEQLVYAITSENNLDFYFINERFVQTDRMGPIVDYDSMKKLKEYEKLYSNR
ncbi:MAG: hypothetical protein KDC12_13045 [Flavobacteriales bacterium]|nr:hypothetical protein [Flavobacteriales bacterium]